MSKDTQKDHTVLFPPEIGFGVILTAPFFLPLGLYNLTKVSIQLFILQQIDLDNPSKSGNILA